MLVRIDCGFNQQISLAFRNLEMAIRLFTVMNDLLYDFIHTTKQKASL